MRCNLASFQVYVDRCLLYLKSFTPQVMCHVIQRSIILYEEKEKTKQQTVKDVCFTKKRIKINGQEVLLKTSNRCLLQTSGVIFILILFQH